jgi:hypothetical protein
MARPARIAALLCSLWLLTAPGWLAGSPALQTAASRQLQYDFGTVRQGDIVVHTFTLPGAAAALSAIDRVDLSHAGMSARFSPRVQAGRSASVTVTWDTGRVMGPVEGQAVVRWADQSRAALTLTLKGTVRPVIEVLPYPAVFFSVYRDESAEQMITILNRDDVPLHISRVVSGGCGSALRGRAWTIPGSPLPPHRASHPATRADRGERVDQAGRLRES